MSSTHDTSYYEHADHELDDNNTNKQLANEHRKLACIGIYLRNDEINSRQTSLE